MRSCPRKTLIDCRHPIVSVFYVIFLLATSTPARPQSDPVDRILIEKSTHTMKLMLRNDIVKTYKVSLSRVPVGAKQHSGDHRVPEGQYFIDSKNRFSKFHLALHISYPNAADRLRAKKLGVDPGGNIEIHGLGSTYGWAGSLHRTIDWTDGCIAVTNPEIEEIFPLVPVGTPVEIRP
jgi:murein L,D-transpeptidase YafK